MLASVDGSALGQVGADAADALAARPRPGRGHRDRLRAGLRRRRPARGGRLVGHHRPREPAPAAHRGRVGARGDRERWRPAPAPRARWRGCRSRWGSAPRACSSGGATTRSGSPAAASARTPRHGRRGHRPRPPGRAGPGDAAHGERPRPGPGGPVTPQRVRDGGQPGHAGLGPGRAGADADPAGAGGQRRCLRAGAPAPQPGDALAGLAGRRGAAFVAGARAGLPARPVRRGRPARRRRSRPTWRPLDPRRAGGDGRGGAGGGRLPGWGCAAVAARRSGPGRTLRPRARRWCWRWP